jgi:cytochrome c oxidase cbb3-type subunit III
VPQLRESVTRPSARIAEGYRMVKAVLRDGRIVGGVARNHNNYSLQVLDKTGKLHLLQVSAIRTIEWADSSMMPAAKEEDAIHLIAFLARQSTRPSGGVQ